MHRLLVDSSLLTEDRPPLPAEAARHLKVLRLREGEGVELFDGRGASRQYEWHQGLVASGDVTRSSRPARTMTLFACVTKGSRWDWTIEKATELGVSRIVPVISERTIVRIAPSERAAKRERWLRIAEDAARQSDARWLPEIVEAVDFAASLELVKATTCFVGALTNPPSRPLAEAIQANRADEMAVFIGPEGDFTPAELDALLKLAIPTSFGASVLRAETAAIYALSVLAAVSGLN